MTERVFASFVVRAGVGVALLCAALFLAAPAAGQAQPGGPQMLFWFRRGEDYGVYIMDIGRHLLREVMDAPPYNIMSIPMVSRDGRRVAYEVDNRGYLQLVIRDVTLGQLYQTPPRYEDRLPGWSPDGSQIAFWSSRSGHYDIYVMNADGTNLRQYTDEIGYYPYNHPLWSPDGRRIVFQYSRPRTHTGILVLDPASGAIQSLNALVGTAADLVWSPDSTRLAFRSDRDRNGEIYVLDFEQGIARNLSDNEAADFQPTWSPDGRRLAFVSTRGGRGSIHVMNADGSDIHALSADIGWSPVWSPDGGHIAFLSNRDGAEALYVMDVEGGNLRRVADLSRRDVFLRWMVVGE